jgi:hypothetical protein
MPLEESRQASTDAGVLVSPKIESAKPAQLSGLTAGISSISVESPAN